MKNNDIPKVFANEITKKINNSQEYSKVEENNFNPMSKIELEKKISTIFKSDKYIYKINTKIITNNGTLEKTLVGKNQKGLITLDNEIINFEDIQDIYVK